MTQQSEPVVIRLNEQQVELVDRTVKETESPSREDLIRRALREFADEELA